MAAITGATCPSTEPRMRSSPLRFAVSGSSAQVQQRLVASVASTSAARSDAAAAFDFLPIRRERMGPWLLETPGDDLAWVVIVDRSPAPPK